MDTESTGANGLAIKRFKSRQNEVSLVPDKTLPAGMCIEKRFADRAKKRKEVSLNACLRASGLAVPEVLGESSDTVRYAYIEGKTLCALLDEAESADCETQALSACIRLCDWLKAFMTATGMIFYDINLRNFIVTRDGLYVVDYEDARSGSTETDFGRLLAFILAYDPAFSALKLRLCARLLRHLCRDTGIDHAALLSAMKTELGAMEKRRAAQYPMRPDAAAAAIEKGNGYEGD